MESKRLVLHEGRLCILSAVGALATAPVPVVSKGKIEYPHVQFNVDVTKYITAQYGDSKYPKRKQGTIGTTLFVPRRKPADFNGVATVVTVRFITTYKIPNRELRAIVSELYGKPTTDFMKLVDEIRRDIQKDRIGKSFGEIDFINLYRHIKGYGKHKTDYESEYFLAWLKGEAKTAPDITRWGRKKEDYKHLAHSTPSPVPASPVKELKAKHEVESVKAVEPATTSEVRVEDGKIIFS